MPIPAFKSTHLEALSRAAVDAVGHRDLSPIFAELGIQERGGTPRWERILLALAARQEQDRCGNNVGKFLEAVMDPARFARRAEEHDGVLRNLNEILAFSGLQLTSAGRLKAVERASTLSETLGLEENIGAVFTMAYVTLPLIVVQGIVRALQGKSTPFGDDEIENEVKPTVQRLHAIAADLTDGRPSS